MLGKLEGSRKKRKFKYKMNGLPKRNMALSLEELRRLLRAGGHSFIKSEAT